RRRKTEARKIEGHAATPLREHLARKAAADVQEHVVPDVVGIVYTEDAVLAIQENPRREIVEAVVLFLFPEVPAESAVKAVLRREVVIDASRGGVVGLERYGGRILIVLLSVRCPGLVRQCKEVHDLLRHRIDHAWRDDVAREWVAYKASGGRRTRPRGEWVVDLILRTQGEELRKIA